MSRKFLSEPLLAISSTQKALRVPRKRIAELISHVQRRQGIRIGQVDLAVVTAGEMAGLNRRYLGRDEPTDVLSFDLSDDSRTQGLCAQLVVCGQVTVAQARMRGLDPQRELLLYVIHGLLHLMGYEDATARGSAKMHAREEALLEEFLAKRGRTR